MKDEMIMYLTERIDWYQREQARLRSESRTDEATHNQIAMNVYSIFQSTYQAMKYDLAAALTKFSSIVDVWYENHRRASENDAPEKKFIEEIKIDRALEIIRRAKELELIHHD